MNRQVRLLIADDAEIVLRAVAQVVEDCCEGVQIVGEAKSYDELMRTLEVAKPDVVLADLNMPAEVPVESGVLKAHLGQACLLVMSAWFDEPSQKRAEACGAAELLDKAKLVDTLQPAIERCMGPTWKAAGR